MARFGRQIIIYRAMKMLVSLDLPCQRRDMFLMWLEHEAAVNERKQGGQRSIIGDVAVLGKYV
jgi:hypothetical protein